MLEFLLFKGGITAESKNTDMIKTTKQTGTVWGTVDQGVSRTCPPDRRIRVLLAGPVGWHVLQLARPAVLGSSAPMCAASSHLWQFLELNLMAVLTTQQVKGHYKFPYLRSLAALRLCHHQNSSAKPTKLRREKQQRRMIITPDSMM